MNIYICHNAERIKENSVSGSLKWAPEDWTLVKSDEQFKKGEFGFVPSPDSFIEFTNPEKIYIKRGFVVALKFDASDPALPEIEARSHLVKPVKIEFADGRKIYFYGEIDALRDFVRIHVLGEVISVE
jgi:hypothetical protein